MKNITTQQKITTAQQPDIKWALDPHAIIFFETIADMLREIENPEQWLKKTPQPKTPLLLDTGENPA